MCEPIPVNPTSELSAIAREPAAVKCEREKSIRYNSARSA